MNLGTAGDLTAEITKSTEKMGGYPLIALIYANYSYQTGLKPGAQRGKDRRKPHRRLAVDNILKTSWA